MGARPRDSNATRDIILTAARDLFVTRGFHGVGIRQIAASAGVDHALVLRHFGGREQLLREIIAGGARALAAMAEPETDDLPPLTVLHEIHRYVLEEGRMTALLVPRAEVDGLAPAVLLAGVQLPLGALASWLGDQASGESGPDPRAVAMVLGAAVFGLAAVQPFLTSSVGFHEEDPSEVMRQCVDMLTGLTGAALRAGQDPGGVQEA